MRKIIVAFFVFVLCSGALIVKEPITEISDDVNVVVVVKDIPLKKYKNTVSPILPSIVKGVRLSHKTIYDNDTPQLANTASVFFTVERTMLKTFLTALRNSGIEVVEVVLDEESVDLKTVSAEVKDELTDGISPIEMKAKYKDYDNYKTLIYKKTAGEQ